MDCPDREGVYRWEMPKGEVIEEIDVLAFFKGIQSPSQQGRKTVFYTLAGNKCLWVRDE